MEVDTKTEKKTLCYPAPNFADVNRYEPASMEVALRSAEKMMRLYDKAFRELAK